MLKKIVIFDLDGTLLDSLADIQWALNSALKEAGRPELPIDEVRNRVGHGLPELVKRSLPDDFDPDRRARILSRVRATYEEIPFRFTKPYPGVVELVDQLSADGHVLAVLTNKMESIARIIIKHFFPSRFDLVHGERPDSPRKPHPASLTALLSALAAKALASGVDGAPHIEAMKASTIMVGDSEADMQTGVAAGVRALGVSWGFRTRRELIDAGADLVVDTAPNLRTIING